MRDTQGSGTGALEYPGMYQNQASSTPSHPLTVAGSQRPGSPHWRQSLDWEVLSFQVRPWSWPSPGRGGGPAPDVSSLGHGGSRGRGIARAPPRRARPPFWDIAKEPRGPPVGTRQEPACWHQENPNQEQVSMSPGAAHPSNKRLRISLDFSAREETAELSLPHPRPPCPLR